MLSNLEKIMMKTFPEASSMERQTWVVALKGWLPGHTSLPSAAVTLHTWRFPVCIKAREVLNQKSFSLHQD